MSAAVYPDKKLGFIDRPSKHLLPSSKRAGIVIVSGVSTTYPSDGKQENIRRSLTDIRALLIILNQQSQSLTVNGFCPQIDSPEITPSQVLVV